ncbi:XRE family transcriptional regulator [Sulfurimonas sp. HSL-1716]|uniref:helix-turn-helix domain-containing protein n=1 Tax=Hydrocurvibacter sulfurireducens TaxID=3131937 RepID=UPI0031F855BF
MSFADNLKKIMNDKNITALDIANKLNVSRGTVTHWSNGVRTPDPDKIKELANILKINVAELFGEKLKSRVRTIPLIGLASCGIPQEYDLNGYEPIPVSEDIYEEGMYAVQAEGNSMSPKINDRAIVYCNIHRQIDNGNIVHYNLNGVSGIKKYKINEKGDIISLVPLNSDYDVITVHADDNLDLKMARVVGVIDMDF